MASKESMELRGVIARNQRWDLIVGTVGLLATALGVIILTLLFLDLVLDGWRRLTPEFFLNFPSRRPEEAGILSAWVGSALVMIVTAFTAVPLGVAAAIYLEEYAPKNWITELIEINVTNLAAVPSIIYGLLALGLFVYILGFGHSILTAGLTLGLMILPIIIVATREALRAIPVAIREAAYALGATRWQVVSDHLIPYASGGIYTGVIIGLSRAIGETAPVITIGALTFIAFLPPHPFQRRSAGWTFRLALLALHRAAHPDVQLAVAPAERLPRQCGGHRHRHHRGHARDERHRHLAALAYPRQAEMVSLSILFLGICA